MNQKTWFINQMIDMLCSGDVDAFVQLFIPSAELILPNAYCVGRDAIRTAVVGMYEVYDNITIELERVLVQDDVVFVQWRWSDRNRLTGQRNETATAIVLEFHGTRIKCWREYHAPVLQ